MGKIPRINYRGQELLAPKTDLVFKALLTAGGDLELLASLLSSILDLDIGTEDVAVMNTELPRTHEKGKLSSVDVRVKLADGKQANVEIQVEDEHNMEKRSIFHASKLYADQMEPGMDYKGICPAISINILDFAFLPFEGYHNRYRLKNIWNGHELTDAFEIQFLELPKVPRKAGNSMIELWLLFFAARSGEDLDMLAEREPIFEKALDRLVYVSADERLRYELDMREKFELDHLAGLAARERKGREEGIEIGIERGVAIGKKTLKVALRKTLRKSHAGRSSK